MGGKALAAQHILRTLLNMSRTRVRSAAGPHGGCRSPCAHRTTAPGEGLEAVDAVRSGVRGILGGVRPPARLEALVQRQAQLASKLVPAVNRALAVSTPKAAGSGLSAARRCGRVRPSASAARSQ